MIVGAVVPGFNRATARNPDRWMRLLHRLGPAVDVAQLRELTVEREHVVALPSLQDQLNALVVLIAQCGRHLAVGIIGVHTGAHRKAGDQAATGDAVEHCKFFSDAQRRVVKCHRITQHHDCDVFGIARQ